MKNFTKSIRNVLVDMNKHAAAILRKDDAAIKKVGLLEAELSQKNKELDQMYKASALMTDNAKHCAAALYSAHNKLLDLAGHLERSNQHIHKLSKENKALKSSSEEWFKRTIKLQFEVLSVKDGLKQIESERDIALKTIGLLQTELIMAHKENNQAKSQL